MEIVRAVREIIPEDMPLFVRISASDWVEDQPSWDLKQSIQLSQMLREAGVDLIDVSSGGLSLAAKMTVGPGYQVPFSQAIRHEVAIPTGAVGLITDAVQAETILATKQADLVLLARELLRDPYWPLHAASELKADNAVEWPLQYQRARK